MSIDIQKLNITVPGQDSFFVQEAIKVIRTNIEFCGRDIKVIALTSYGENEGKTTISAHIASSLSELGKRVLLIDADMRKSVFSGRNTDSTDYTGLSEVLSGMRELSECIHETTVPGFYLLQAGKHPPNPVELINSIYFEELIKTARGLFDYVIIDTPPLGYAIDSAIIATFTDGVVIVIGDKNLRRRQLRSIMSQLRRSDCRVLGAIYNNKKAPRHGYHYYKKSHGHKYGHGYGYGHGNHSYRANNSTAHKK